MIAARQTKKESRTFLFIVLLSLRHVLLNSCVNFFINQLLGPV